MDWPKVAKERGFVSDYAMLLHYSKRKIGTETVGKMLGVSGTAVRQRMQKLGVPRMPPGLPKDKISRGGLTMHKKKAKTRMRVLMLRYNKKTERDLLHHLYWVRNMTLEEIAAMVTVTYMSIRTKMERLGIRRRSPGQRKRNVSVRK